MRQAYGLGERRACGLVVVWRSTVRYQSRRAEPAEQIAMMKLLAVEHPRYGSRGLQVVMVRQGWR
jgi:putative transposase